MNFNLQNLKEKFSDIKQTWEDYKAAESAYNKTKPELFEDREFLPAALEIQETPPSPVGRITMISLCLFVVIAVLWAIFGKVDIVVVGQGRIIPSGYVKLIQPFETGVISAIHVQNGQKVKKGDLLVELDITQTDADRLSLEKQLPLTREKFKITQKLYEEGTTSKFDLLTQQKDLIQMEQELKKAQQRVLLQNLTSPIDGIVQELKIHTIAGIVTPAQELMKIVPQKASLEAEIMLENKDIGFLEEGQGVKIKLEAFPFTKYGMIDGKVLHLSNDAIQNEDLGPVFSARISMDESTIQVEKRLVQLTPGMSLSGEIKTGNRRIIEYFLSPILKYKAEVIRER